MYAEYIFKVVFTNIIIPMFIVPNIIGNIKFIFCFTTAYSVFHCSFGLFKSIIKHSILNDIFIKIDTANTIIKSVIDIGSKYHTIPNTISIENIFINVFDIIL